MLVRRQDQGHPFLFGELSFISPKGFELIPAIPRVGPSLNFFFSAESRFVLQIFPDSTFHLQVESENTKQKLLKEELL